MVVDHSGLWHLDPPVVPIKAGKSTSEWCGETDPQSLEGRSLDKFELGMLQAPVFAAWLSEDCFTHFGQRPKNRMETELILPEVGKN